MDIQAELWAVIQQYWHLLVKWTPKLVVGLVVILLFWFLAVRVRIFMSNRLRMKMDDPLLVRFLSRLTKWCIILLGIALSLRVMGMGDIAGGLIAGAGVSAFILGFAFKDIGENFLAGIILAFNRPFKVGHTIESESQIGNVVALDLRTTQIKTFDGKDVFIPNGMLIKNALINYTIDGYLRQDFTISVDYQTDLNKALPIILEALESIPGILKDEKMPTVTVSRLDSSSIALQVFYWLDTFDTSVSGLKLKTEAVKKTLNALESAGVYMPAEIVELKNYENTKMQISSSPSDN